MAKKLEVMRHFLRYCVAQDWLERSPFEGLKMPVHEVTRSKVPKEAFTDGELVLILKELARHRLSDLPIRREFYYVILLLLHTGARCREMWQLDRANVKQVEGVWIVDVLEAADRTDKHLKNSSSRRRIPLHSNVLPVFLPWFHEQTNRKLFPIIASEVKGDGTQLVSRWFSELLTKIKVKRSTVSLHCLRRTLTHKLTRAHTNTALQNRFFGHIVAPGVEGTSYQRGVEFPVSEVKEAIEAVTFPTLS
jgi:integrase